MKPALFDEADTDLVRRADAASLNLAIMQLHRAPHGFRLASRRRLQRIVMEQLSREMAHADIH